MQRNHSIFYNITSSALHSIIWYYNYKNVLKAYGTKYGNHILEHAMQNITFQMFVTGLNMFQGTNVKKDNQQSATNIKKV